MQTIVKDLRQASYVIGLSATPWRDDGKDLDMEGVLGHVLYEVSASRLIEEGHLMAPEIKCVSIEAEPDLRDEDYPTLYKLQVVENPERNRFIGKLAHQNKKQGRKLQLIIVRQLKHVDLLMKALRPRQLVAVSLTGKETGAVRQDKLNLAKAGAVDVIVATTVADEGLDLPMLDTVILAGGGKSTARALQRVGRAIRKYPNKLDPVIYDLFDENLERQCDARWNAYKTEPAYKVVRI
jgi:superfamily II DNA or RNA helicase